MYCADCGASNPEDTPFCVDCGIRLAVNLDAADTQELPTAHGAPTPRTLRAVLERAAEMADAGELDDAIDMCRRAVIMEPRNRPAHALLGLLYEKKGHTKFAIREYKVVLEIDPSSAAERAKLERLLEQEKQDTQHFAPVIPPDFWQRWRIAIIGGGGAMALGLIAVIVHFVRQAAPLDTTPIPMAVRTAPAEASADLYRPPTNPRGAPWANRTTPYPVRSDGSIFRPPNWDALATRQPGDGGRDTPVTARRGPTPEITVPRVVEPNPMMRTPGPPPREGPPGEGPPGPDPGATGVFEPVEEGPPPPEGGGGPAPLLEIQRVEGTRTADNSMFQPVERGPGPAPTTTGEDEEAGRAAQMRGLRLKAEGRHQEAIAEFRQAISAYQREMGKRGSSDKLLRAIETCKHGIEYSESRL
ncbi:MAG: hypothetical protein ACE5R4_17500, partial [Armatimonadota bacterium]